MQIPVFLACDDNYAPFLCTTMYSILKNTKSYIEFYVMDGGIKENNKNIIKKSLSKFSGKFDITYFDMSKFDLSRFPNLKHYSLNTFSRYFIPELKPNLGKILYIDVDVIVTGDISELYNQDMGKYPVAAVLEDFYSGNYTTLKEKIWPKFKSGDKYFNAGVLLLDIQKFIKKDYSKKLVNLTIKLFDKLNCPDQDVFNIVFENNFKVLDYKYNFMPDHDKMLYEKHPKIPHIKPLIIHYTWKKPWREKSNAQKEFDIILKKTLFYKIINKKFSKNKYMKYYFLGLPILKMEEI